MNILHKAAIANVIVNNFDDVVSENATSVNEEVLNSLIKQEEKELEKNLVIYQKIKNKMN